ncbi:MAG: hypothetical protein AAGE80_05415 [Pseudomonadota bacterium]
MSHGTEGKVFDRVAMTWLPRAEYERRKAIYEERAFQRRSNQGQLAAPRIISDIEPFKHGDDIIQSRSDERDWMRENDYAHYEDVGEKKPEEPDKGEIAKMLYDLSNTDTEADIFQPEYSEDEVLNDKEGGSPDLDLENVEVIE